MMKIINKSDLPRLLELFSRDAQVMLPQNVDGVTRFAPWSQDAQPVFNENVTIPPKELLFPQTETMYRYRGDTFEMEVEEEIDGQKRIAFGLRSCDCQSFKLMDHVFLTKGFADQFYRRKRENLTIIALGCLAKGTACFCDSLGINPAETDEADIQAFDLGEKLAFTAKSARGEELLQKSAGLLRDEEISVPATKAGGLAADLEGLSTKLRQMFSNSYWDRVYEKCLGCGTCTFLCPTCHCFDIQSINKGKEGLKYRTWDSCMYPEYTLMAGGHNPRPTRKERVRQRFLHKLRYFPERYGAYGCVGCGRCIMKCPVNLDITRVIAGLGEVAADA